MEARKYCKAYYVKDLRRFASWTEVCEPHEAELVDDDVVYIWDDFTVVRNPIPTDQDIILSTVTAEWRHFCQITLQFTVPEDLYSASKEFKAPGAAVQANGATNG